MTIFKKLDYYSVMLHGTTLRKILEKFGFDTSVVDAGEDGLGLIDLFSGVKNTAPGGLLKVSFFLPQVKVHVPYNVGGFTGGLDVSADALRPIDDDFDVETSTRVLDTVLQGVRVEMAGGELDAFRLLGYCPESCFSDPEYWIGGDDPVAAEFKVTRADFAFDFLDLPEPYTDIARKLCVFVNEVTAVNPQGYVFSTDDNRGGGLKCRSAFSAEETCGYVGSPGQGNVAFLRAYDKLQERCRRLGTDQSLWPAWMAEEYRTCQSWVRFELQTRGTKAIEQLFKRDPVSGIYLTGEDIMDEAWKTISTRYCICEKKNVPFALLRSFYDMITEKVAADAEKRHEVDGICILCNSGATFAGLDEAYSCTPAQLGIHDKLERWKHRNLRWILLWIGIQGKQGVLNDANELLDYLIDGEGFSVRRRRLQLFSDLEAASLLNGTHYTSWPGFGVTPNNRLICSFDRMDELPSTGEEIADLYGVDCVNMLDDVSVEQVSFKV